MKSPLFTVLVLLCLPLWLIGQQTHKERITKEFTLETASAQTYLAVRNIFGGVEVSGYEGATVVLEVIKTISAKSEADLNRGKEEVQLGVAQAKDVILLYMNTPCNDYDLEDLSPEKLAKGWSFWKNNCRWDPDFEMKLDFKLKVPRQINLDVSTVNEGDIALNDIEGQLKVNNVNGAITLEKIKGSTKARTVNGDVNVDYTQNPSGDCSYYTLNGDINAHYRPGLSAEVYFKSFNGEFFTNLENLQPFAPKLQKTEGKTTKYKVNGNFGFETGGGGAKLEFETFNGDVYLKTE